MSASVFSKTLSGRRHPTADDLDRLEGVLQHRLGAEYEEGTLRAIWAAEDDAQSPSAPDAEADDTDRPSEIDESTVPGIRTFAALALLVAIAVGVYLLSGSDSAGDGSAPTASEVMAHCDPEIGDLAPSVSGDMAAWVVPMRTRYSRSLSDYSWPCPVDLARPILGGQALAQEMEDREGVGAVIVASSSTRAVTLKSETWASVLTGGSIHELLGLAPLGPPLRLEPHGDHSRVITASAAAIGVDRAGPHFLIPASFVEKWDDLGGSDSPLGLPMTHPYIEGDRIEVAFEGGLLVAESGSLDFVSLVDDRQGALPRSLDRVFGVAVTPDGSHWFIEDSTRRWIADPDVLRCLGLDPQLVSGQALAEFPLAANAAC